MVLSWVQVQLDYQKQTQLKEKLQNINNLL